MRRCGSAGPSGAWPPRPNGADQLGLLSTPMCLNPEIPLLTFARLIHLGVSLGILVLRRAGSLDDRHINNGAVRDLDAVAPKLLVNGLQQHLVELGALREVPELAHCRLIRCPSTSRSNTHKAAHRHRVVQFLLQRRVRQVGPQLQKVGPRHPLPRNRCPATGLADRRIDRLHRRRHLRPGNTKCPSSALSARSAPCCGPTLVRRSCRYETCALRPQRCMHRAGYEPLQRSVETDRRETHGGGRRVSGAHTARRERSGLSSSESLPPHAASSIAVIGLGSWAASQCYQRR